MRERIATGDPFQQDRSVSLRSLLFSKTAMLLGMRLGGAGAGFVTQLVLARMLAPEDLGLFFAATSLAIVLATVTALGYPEIAPRFISRYQERGRPEALSGFLRQAKRDSLMLGSAIGLIVAVKATIWPVADRDVEALFLLVAVMIPVLALFAVNSGVALSRRMFFAAYGYETFLRPILFLGALVAIFLGPGDAELWIVAALFFGITAALAFAQHLVLRGSMPKMAPRVDPRLAKRWRREGAPQIAVAIYTLLFADLAIILASIPLGATQLAAFGIALKLAMLVGFGVQVAHQVIIPDLADAHASRRLRGAGDVMRAAAAFPVVFSLVALVAILLVGDRVLALFHPDFAEAQWALAILVACQFLRAIAGPSGQLLTVAGAQMTNAGICLASTAVLAVGNVLLAPAFGLTGAAAAVFVAWTFWLVAAAYCLHRITGMRCDLPALLARRPAPAARPAAGE